MTDIFSIADALGIEMPESKLPELQERLEEALFERDRVLEQGGDIALHEHVIKEIRRQMKTEADKLK
jgi:hypothetical protein